MKLKKGTINSQGRPWNLSDSHKTFEKGYPENPRRSRETFEIETIKSQSHEAFFIGIYKKSKVVVKHLK